MRPGRHHVPDHRQRVVHLGEVGGQWRRTEPQPVRRPVVGHHAPVEQGLAAFKVPKQIEFRSELPKTMVGKVLRRVLVEEEKAKGKTG